MIPDAAPVGSQVQLRIDKFDDSQDSDCEHWHFPVSGRHCGHYIESVTTTGTVRDDGTLGQEGM